MTRLNSTDINGLANHLADYDARLRNLTGTGLAGIAARAVGKDQDAGAAAATEILSGKTVAVAPITYGEGVIMGFAEAMRAIAVFLGADAFITGKPNIMGLAEAVERGADIITLSDDDDLVALNPAGRAFAHNSEATGRGFAAALELMAARRAGGIQKNDVLVIGAGPVGSAAAHFLAERGAKVWIHDRVTARAEAAIRHIPDASMTDDLREALGWCQFVIEATPEANVIRWPWLTTHHIIAAPGVPFGVENSGAEDDEVDDDGGKKADGSGPLILHDKLEIGVAVMLAAAARRQKAENRGQKT